MHAGFASPQSVSTSRRAFTLVEALIGVTLTLILMSAVVGAFSIISGAMTEGRATVEMNDRLRTVKQRLQADLAGLTVVTIPPRDPARNEGYLVIKEGDIFAPTTTLTDAWLNTDYKVRWVDEDLNGVADDVNKDGNTDFQDVDTTVGDLDDVLMFTTRSTSTPFVGRWFNPITNLQETIESYEAEVAYFVRGTTLYRRVLLVAPNRTLMPYAANDSFYWKNDISARMVGATTGGGVSLDRRNVMGASATYVPNTLGDLTNPANRYGHQPYVYPHSIDFWHVLGLPTLRESSHAEWPFPGGHNLPAVNYVAIGADPFNQLVVPLNPDNSAINVNGRRFEPANFSTAIVDAWRNPTPWTETPLPAGGINFGSLERYNANSIPIELRDPADVVLTNVLEFDVKVWDPGAPHVLDQRGTPNDPTDDILYLPGDAGYADALERMVAGGGGAPVVGGYGAYVDLGYTERPFADNVAYPMATSPPSYFAKIGGVEISPGTSTMFRIYDTWSTHFEHDGVDNDGDGTVDEGTLPDSVGVQEAPPPYSAPLRGIRISIRTYEPDSRQIRQVTLVHDFLPE